MGTLTEIGYRLVAIDAEKGDNMAAVKDRGEKQGQRDCRYLVSHSPRRLAICVSAAKPAASFGASNDVGEMIELAMVTQLDDA